MGKFVLFGDRRNPTQKSSLALSVFAPEPSWWLSLLDSWFIPVPYLSLVSLGLRWDWLSSSQEATLNRAD